MRSRLCFELDALRKDIKIAMLRAVAPPLNSVAILAPQVALFFVHVLVLEAKVVAIEPPLALDNAPRFAVGPVDLSGTVRVPSRVVRDAESYRMPGGEKHVRGKLLQFCVRERIRICRDRIDCK